MSIQIVYLSVKFKGKKNDVRIYLRRDLTSGPVICISPPIEAAMTS